MRHTITVIGAGNVGATPARRLAERDYADIVLVGRARRGCQSPPPWHRLMAKDHRTRGWQHWAPEHLSSSRIGLDLLGYDTYAVVPPPGASDRQLSDTMVYTSDMATVTLRELARQTASVIQGVQSSGRAALVTRNGRPVVALIPIDEAALEDWLLERAPDITRAVANADADLTAGRKRGADWRRAQEDAGDGTRPQPSAARRVLRGSHRGD